MEQPTIILTTNVNGDPVYAYVTKDFTVFNARASECGRFIVSPAHYGLTDEQADALAALNAANGYDDTV